MVDKDGNKVDIMQDLTRLEGELKSYLKEVDDLINEAKQFETAQVSPCHEDFSNDIPKVVKDLRKIR